MDRTIFSDYLVRLAIVRSACTLMPNQLEFSLFLVAELARMGWSVDESVSEQDRALLENCISELTGSLYSGKKIRNFFDHPGSPISQAWLEILSAFRFVVAGEQEQAARYLSAVPEILVDSPFAQAALALLFYLVPSDSSEKAAGSLKEFAGGCMEIDAAIALCCGYTDSSAGVEKAERSAEGTELLSMAEAIHLITLGGDYARAREILTELRVGRTASPLALLWLAKCIICEAKIDLQDLPLPGETSEQIASRLQLAEDALKELAGRDGISVSATYAGVCLQSALDVLQFQPEACLETSRQILSLHPEDPAGLLAQGCALAQQCKYSEALTSLKKVEEPLRKNALLLMAAILQDADNSSMAAHMLEEHFDATGETPDTFELTLLVQTNFKAGKRRVAYDLFRKLDTVSSEPGLVLWQSGDLCLHDDDFEKALPLIESARDISTGNRSRWMTWEMARINFFQGQSLTACDLFKSIVPPFGDTPVVRDFITVLFKGGLAAAASERARHLRMETGGGVIQGITEMEINHLVSERKIEEARQLLEALIEKNPSDLLRVTLLRMHASLGDVGAAREVLSQIDQDSLDEDTRAELEQLKSKLGVMQDASDVS